VENAPKSIFTTSFTDIGPPLIEEIRTLMIVGELWGCGREFSGIPKRHVRHLLEHVGELPFEVRHESCYCRYRLSSVKLAVDGLWE
jgi:hypothetical protein